MGMIVNSTVTVWGVTGFVLLFIVLLNFVLNRLTKGEFSI